VVHKNYTDSGHGVGFSHLLYVGISEHELIA
jgi:hypothetical protein